MNENDIYRSPCCGKPLHRGPEDWLCEACRRAFPLDGDIPILLLDAAFYKCAGCGRRMETAAEHRESCKGD